MDGPGRDEYRALRAAIAARGTTRATLFVAGMAAWAGVLTAVLAALPIPLVSVVPLVVLVATFEAIRPLHLGAERIGRYLQVFHEERGEASRPLSETPAWERTAMAVGGQPGGGGHPLYAAVFFIATVVNYLAVLLPGPVPIELGLLAVPHLTFVVWLVLTDRAARAQRARDLARYRDLRG